MKAEDGAASEGILAERQISSGERTCQNSSRRWRFPLNVQISDDLLKLVVPMPQHDGSVQGASCQEAILSDVALGSRDDGHHVEMTENNLEERTDYQDFPRFSEEANSM